MNVVVFSGTTEGRSFSRALAALGAAVTVCVATELGAEEQGCADGITVRTGRLDAEGMTALLRGAALCVDATHPYAAEATRNIRAAAAAAVSPTAPWAAARTPSRWTTPWLWWMTSFPRRYNQNFEGAALTGCAFCERERMVCADCSGSP